MEIDGQTAEVVPQAEMTSENYYFDSYSHFGERTWLCLRWNLQQQTQSAPANKQQAQQQQDSMCALQAQQQHRRVID